MEKVYVIVEVIDTNRETDGMITDVISVHKSRNSAIEECDSILEEQIELASQESRKLRRIERNDDGDYFEISFQDSLSIIKTTYFIEESELKW